MSILKQSLLVILTLVAVLPLRAQITGNIVDATSGESIPFASVVYQGHNVASVSDIDGHYRIDRHNGWRLSFSSVGYKTITIDINSGIKSPLNIRLQQDEKMLKEVTIKTKKGRYSRKNNPAVELMKKVIAAKKQTDLSNRDFYQYNKYQKITLAFNDVNTDTLKTSRFKKWPWLKDHIEKSPYNGKMILPISVDETVTQRVYRKDPRSEKDIITGQNSTGINELFQTGDILTVAIKDVFTDVNIYDDQIRLLQYPFTSPIGKDAIAFYRFYIEDTLYVDKDWCFHLHFLPNNQQDFGFRGDIYILADSSFQVKRCDLTLPKQTGVNFVQDMKIIQEFNKLPDSTWVLTRDDMVAELSMAKFMSGIIVARTTRLSDYAFDELPKQLFKGKTRQVKEASAMMRGEEFWQKYRQVELSKTENNMDGFVSNIQNIKGFKYIIFGAKALIENFVETGKPSKIDLGPMNTIITRNSVDGWRARISGQTTANLNKHWFFSGYYAHGFNSKREYYKADIIYSFNKKDYLPREFPKRTLSLMSTYDVMSPSDKFMRTDKDNMFTAFKWARVDKMMFYNRQQLSFEYEEEWGLKTTLSLKTEENEACDQLFFTPLSMQPAGTSESPDRPGSHISPNPPSKNIRTTELHAELRFAPGETYINTKQRRLKINLDVPVFTLGHTVGVKGFLGGDYNYNYTEASIYKRFWMNSWGKIDIYIQGGIQWNKVPFLMLCMPATNLSYILQDQTFSLINNMEFLNDRFASANIGWDFNGKIFNRIPLLKKLKWREFIGFRCLWGSLSDKNNPYLAQNAGDPILMSFPEGSHIMDSKEPYMEMSFGIHNILKILHVEYIRRLNYNSLPTANKHGVRFMVRMTF